MVVVRTGRRGRPRKLVSPEFLRDAFAAHRNLSVAAVACSLGVSRDLLTRHRLLHGIKRAYHPMTDDEMDDIVRALKQASPEMGLKLTWGFFRSQNIKVVRERVRESLRRVDPVGVELRAQTAVQRRTYTVPRPNAVWHADGHHKLVPWGFVIHGLIDGYCRTVSCWSADS